MSAHRASEMRRPSRASSEARAWPRAEPSPAWTERGADRMDQTWYGPAFRYVKKISNRRCEEVDVVFCKFELDDGSRPKIGIPEVLPGV